MERAGEKLRRTRERLKLTYRDVVQASQAIAARRGSDEYAIALSRLADIENKGTVPTIYRLYTLCAIYRLDFDELMRWYGVPRELLVSESVQTGLGTTHLLQLAPGGVVTIPQPANCEIDVNRTSFLSHLIRRWGRMPLSFLNGMDLPQYRYAFIGMDDWSMYPVLHPGSLLAIDQSQRKIAKGGWANELDRPIYFLEHRTGYICGWCTFEDNRLIVQPHPASQANPSVFEAAAGIDVIGQVVGVAMLLESTRRRGSAKAV